MRGNRSSLAAPWLAALVCLVTGVSVSPWLDPAPVSAQEGQAAVDANQVNQWLESAESLLKQSKGDTAAALFEKAIEHARRLGLSEQHAQALVGLGEIFHYRAQFPAARAHAEQSLEIYERLRIHRGIGRASYLISLVARAVGNTNEARRFAERAVDAYETAGYRYGRGLATLQLLLVTDDPATDRLFDRIIEDARAAGAPQLEARALHSQADDLFTRAEYVGAFEKLEAAAALFDEAGDRRALGTVYNSLGRLYRRHGRADVALSYQLKALAMHEATQSPTLILQSLNAVAVTYQALGDPRNARVYFDRALPVAEKSGSPWLQDFVRANLASLMVDQGDYAGAARTLEGVVARGLDRYPSNRLGDLSDAYLRTGRKDEALAAAQKAVALCGDRQLECISALIRRADAYEALANRRAASDDVRAALTRVEGERSRLVPADFLKQQFSLARDWVYSRTIALQLDEGHATAALETAELARSRAFLDLLASRDVQIRDNRATASPADARTAGDPLRGQPIVFRGPPRESAGVQPGRPGDQPALPSQVTATAASAADLKATAARLQSTLLAYWVTPRKVFIWVVTPAGSVRAAHADVSDARLKELIHATTPFESSAPGGPSVVTRGEGRVPLQPPAPNAWRELHDLLIKPVRQWLPASPGALVTVVPHGSLAALPFAALQDARGRYLLEDYSLHYAPAAAVLQFTERQRHDGARAGRFLLVADPASPPVSKLDAPLPRLPGARAEARAVAGLVPRARTTTLENGRATEAAVRSALEGRAVLHFASHAIVRDEEPFSSFLAVAPASGESSADGFLTAHEIYALNLDADLVVLSACRSAGGRVIGDGVSTFARAFIYAGAPSLVASLWDVADAPTSRLLPDFYKSWLSGASKARALRAAQLNLLRDLRANKVRIDTPAGLVTLPEHPVFWAGFVLFGEPQ